jgi:hypothetical protein
MPSNSSIGSSSGSGNSASPGHKHPSISSDGGPDGPSEWFGVARGVNVNGVKVNKIKYPHMPKRPDEATMLKLASATGTIGHNASSISVYMVGPFVPYVKERFLGQAPTAGVGSALGAVKSSVGSSVGSHSPSHNHKH